MSKHFPSEKNLKVSRNIGYWFAMYSEIIIYTLKIIQGDKVHIHIYFYVKIEMNYLF